MEIISFRPVSVTAAVAGDSRTHLVRDEQTKCQPQRPLVPCCVSVCGLFWSALVLFGHVWSTLVACPPLSVVARALCESDSGTASDLLQ